MLKLGTLFSNYESVRVARDVLGLQHMVHGLYVENQKVRRELIETCVNRRRYVDDVTTHAPATLGNVGLLVWGPSCQPFSKAGKGLGVGDARNLMNYGLHYIWKPLPRCRIIEVVGIQRYKPFWRNIVKRVKMRGRGNCAVYTCVRDTAEHELPKRRRRMYVSVISKKHRLQGFSFKRASSDALHQHMAELGNEL